MFEIILNLKSEEELPISGFPRNIYDVHEPESVFSFHWTVSYTTLWLTDDFSFNHPSS